MIYRWLTAIRRIPWSDGGANFMGRYGDSIDRTCELHPIIEAIVIWPLMFLFIICLIVTIPLHALAAFIGMFLE